MGRTVLPSCTFIVSSLLPSARHGFAAASFGLSWLGSTLASSSHAPLSSAMVRIRRNWPVLNVPTLTALALASLSLGSTMIVVLVPPSSLTSMPTSTCPGTAGLVVVSASTLLIILTKSEAKVEPR